MPIDEEYQWRLWEKLNRSAEPGNPEGIDAFYHDALRAWAILVSLSETKIKKQIGGGILGCSIYQGQAHILFLSIGRLWDKNNDIKFSYKNMLEDRLVEKLPCVDDAERALIKQVRQHPERHEGLNYCMKLRHEVFAHNRDTVVQLDLEKLQEALRFLSRVSFLVDSVITVASTPAFLQDFRFVEGNLAKLIDRDAIKLAEKMWRSCKNAIKVWRENSLLAELEDF